MSNSSSGYYPSRQDWITNGDHFTPTSTPSAAPEFTLTEVGNISVDNMQIGSNNDATLVVPPNAFYTIRHTLQLGSNANHIDSRDSRRTSQASHAAAGELYIASNGIDGSTGQFNVLGDIVTGATGTSTLTLDDFGTDGIDWGGRGIADPNAFGDGTFGINQPNFHIQEFGSDEGDSSFDAQGRRIINDELDGGSLIKRDHRVIDGESVKFTVATGNIKVDNFNIGHSSDGAYTHTRGLIEVGSMRLARDANVSGVFNAKVTTEDGQAVFASITSGDGASTVNVSSADGDFRVGAFVAVASGAGAYSFDANANRYIADRDQANPVGMQDFDFVPGNATIGVLNIGAEASTSYTQLGGVTNITGSALDLGRDANEGVYKLEGGVLNLNGGGIAFANEGSAFEFSGGTLVGLGDYASTGGGHNLEQSGGVLAVDTNSVASNDYIVTDSSAEILFDLNDGAKRMTVKGQLDGGEAILRIAAPAEGGMLSVDIAVDQNDTKQLIKSGELEILTYDSVINPFVVINEAPSLVTVNTLTATSLSVSINVAYNTLSVDGTLDVNGQAASANTVTGDGLINNGDTLIVNTLLSPGVLEIATDNLSLGASSDLQIDLWGVGSGGVYDQLQHSGTGALDLGGANLALNFEVDSNAFFIPQDGDVFDIITYGGAINNALIYNGQTLVDDGTAYDVTVNGEELQFKYIDANNIISLEFLDGLLGDFDDDGDLDLIDIDLLSAAINSGANNMTFDVNGDGLVNAQDGTDWLNNELVGSLAADFDLKYTVDVADLATWAAGFGSDDSFIDGDANFNGMVDVADLSVWAALFGSVGVGPIAPLGSLTASIPEPSTFVLLGGVLLAFASAGRSRRD